MSMQSTYDDYYQMCYVSAPDQSADGTWIAYTLSRPQPRDYAQTIRLLNRSTGAEIGVTANGVREHNPCFSACGRQLAFISDASGVDQIWIAAIVDGQVQAARQLTRLRFGVHNPIWSPDGTRLAFLSDCLPDEDTMLLQTEETAHERTRRREAEQREPVVIEDYGYKRDDAMGFAPKRVTHLWVISLDGSAARRLSDGNRDHIMPVWSPDGQRLVFASNRCRPREESIGMDLFAVSADGGAIERLTEQLWIAWYPKAFQPLFTPDGQTLVFAALEPDLSGGLPPTRLYRIPANGGEAVSLWPDDAPCYEATCFLYNAENYGSFPRSAQIGPDGTWLYFLSGWQGACNIYQARIQGEAEIRPLTTGKHCYRSLGEPIGDALLAARGDFKATPQLFEVSLTDGQAVQLTDTNPWLRRRSLSDAAELWIDTLDGKGRVHGFILPPQQQKQGRKYPTVLYIHGGPTPFYGYALTYEYQLLAAAGFGVILCNPRGSGGYGASHGALSQATDGTALYDLLQFVQEAVRVFPWIDGDRLGVTGGSYGGYMTNWLVTQTQRFKAAVTQRSIANFLISYASSDMAGSARDYKDFSDFMKAELRRSPVAYADRIDIPFLILHGLGDMRCPVEQAHQLYTAVKDAQPDLPVRLVLFPDANHSLTMEGPMHLRIAHYKETVDWFSRYLKEETACTYCTDA